MRYAVLILALLAIGAGVAWRIVGRSGPDRVAFPVPREEDVLEVEVLNAVGVDGLARSVTFALRARGIDVVSYGTAPFDTLPVTRIIARRGDTTAARRVQEALGVGQVADEPDARLLLDVSVYLGRDAVGRVGERSELPAGGSDVEAATPPNGH